MPAVVECHELRKRFGERLAVDGVSFEVGAGECYGLLGPNGAGKTTTISMICGLLGTDSGTVTVAGKPVTPAAVDAKAAIGYVPQEIALYPDLSAAENLRFFGSLYGLNKKHLAARVADVLEVVGLSDRAGDRVATFSGGMQRRANIAAGLLHEPALLVLDEPTVGVDPQSRNAILESVEQLVAAGRSVLYTTHYMEEAERLCDRVGIIDEGRVIAEGTRRELVERIHGRDRIRVAVSGDREGLAQRVRALDPVDEVAVTDDGIDVVLRDGRRHLPAIIAAAAGGQADVTSVEVKEPDLEAVFLQMTGKALRD